MREREGKTYKKLFQKMYDEKEAVLKLIREPFYWIEELTDRQREVLALACRGFRASQISEEMGLKVRSATGLITRAVKIINKWEGLKNLGYEEIEPKHLPNILLKLIEEELDDGKTFCN